MAWKLYEADNRDYFPLNMADTVGGIPESVSNSWVLGNTQYDTTASNIVAGSLYAYSTSAAIYHCPADISTVKDNPALTRGRSYSADGWLSSGFMVYGQNSQDDMASGFTEKTRESFITRPGPSEVFVLIDDNEQTIDDGLFIIGTIHWFDYPAGRHSQGANLSFLDGHAEHHRIEDSLLSAENDSSLT